MKKDLDFFIDNDGVYEEITEDALRNYSVTLDDIKKAGELLKKNNVPMIKENGKEFYAIKI